MHEWKQVATFYTRFIYVLTSFSDIWGELFLEKKTDEVVSCLVSYQEFFDNICLPASLDNPAMYNKLTGIVESSQASGQASQISDRFADAIQIDDSITIQSFLHPSKGLCHGAYLV
jgi:hypothetical protein